MSFIRNSRLFNIVVIVVIFLTLRMIFRAWQEDDHTHHHNYNKIDDEEDNYAPNSRIHRRHRRGTPQKHSDHHPPQIVTSSSSSTNSPVIFPLQQKSSSCPNILKNEECKQNLLSSPKFSDFPEYTWPNQSQLLNESPLKFIENNKDTSTSTSSSIFLQDDTTINNQIKNLQCSTPASSSSSNTKAKKDLIKLYVPWKSFTYMTPYPLTSVCPTTKCELTSSKEDVTSALDGYLVDSNGAYVNEVYDWVRNPLNLVLIAFNTENIEGRRAALKKGYGLRYLAKPWNSTWWNYFHITASYQRHSQVMISFFHWALCRDDSFQEGYFHWAKKILAKSSSKKSNSNSLPSSASSLSLSVRGKLKHKLRFQSPTQQNAPILYFVRNCDFASHRRSGFMTRLQKYIQIDSVGKCNNNRDPRSISICDGMKSKNRRSCIISDYRFYLAIENSISLDYVSEKVYEPLLVGTIPIYLGAPNVADFLPAKHSAILAKDFSSLKQLSEYVKCIMKNSTLYEYYTSWYERPLLPGFERIISRKSFAPMCEICEKIAKVKRERNGVKPDILNAFDTDEELKNGREPGVSGEFLDFDDNSQAPLKECLK